MPNPWATVCDAVDARRDALRGMNVMTADAGKTTLTEKLLLYGGAIHEAGAVKARRSAKHATSDWYGKSLH